MLYVLISLFETFDCNCLTPSFYMYIIVRILEIQDALSLIA